GSGQAAFSTTRLNVTGSPHTITATYNPAGPYMTSSGTANLTVTPAPLTIRADNLSRVYGSANPALTASYSGFVNAHTAASPATRPCPPPPRQPAPWVAAPIPSPSLPAGWSAGIAGRATPRTVSGTIRGPSTARSGSPPAGSARRSASAAAVG